MLNKKIKIVLLGGIVLLVGLIISMLPGKNKATQNLDTLELATFAGGCFWCVEADFEKLPGVVEVISGYTGGSLANPGYEQVSSGDTDHREAVQVYYQKNRLSYRGLIQYFLQHIDPTDASGSFADRGAQYTSAIFYANDEERKIAESEISRLQASEVFEKKIATEVLELLEFYSAEDYHQDYYTSNKLHYKNYRSGSGRDDFLKKFWESNSPEVKNYQEEIVSFDLSKLTPLQYSVTQEEGTEPAFENEYWDETREGIYVDVVSGEPLFSSLDKYKSGTGWPSFTKPLQDDFVVELADEKLFSARTEIRSSKADSHLGHVFNDGPASTGQRYCINSAALRFVPKEALEKEGLMEYLEHFK